MACKKHAEKPVFGCRDCILAIERNEREEKERRKKEREQKIKEQKKI